MAEKLEDLFRDLAQAAGEVTVDTGEGTVEYRRGAQLFAVAGPRDVELRLMPDIAEAARRTPATAGSARGEEWIRFSPPALDQHAIDRAEAWFLIAYRAAAN